jgi:hypothetical protein
VVVSYILGDKKGGKGERVVGNLFETAGASPKESSISVASFDGGKVLDSLTDGSPGGVSVNIRAPRLLSDQLFERLSPNSISPDGRLTLGFPLSPNLSSIDMEGMRGALEPAIQRSCGAEYSVHHGEGQSGRPGLVIFRTAEAHGLPFEERVAEFDYRWRGFIEYRYSPEASPVTTPVAMEREGRAALNILKDFIDSYHQLSGEPAPQETLRLSVER